MSHDRQKRSSLDRCLVKVIPCEPQIGPTREKETKGKEKTPECQIPSVLFEADSPSKQ
jgi:hypothetical protein